jgi:hypothetical protein
VSRGSPGHGDQACKTPASPSNSLFHGPSLGRFWGGKDEPRGGEQSGEVRPPRQSAYRLEGSPGERVTFGVGKRRGVKRSGLLDQMGEPKTPPLDGRGANLRMQADPSQDQVLLGGKPHATRSEPRHQGVRPSRLTYGTAAVLVQAFALARGEDGDALSVLADSFLRRSASMGVI